MKRILYFGIVIAAIGLVWYGCKKDKAELKEELSGSIYGRIIKQNDNKEPISHANVEISPIGGSKITGSDGCYEFPKLAPGIYKLNVTAEGYDSIVNYEVTVIAGVSANRDIPMKKKTPSFRIVGEDGKDIDELNFGDEQTDNSRPFSIVYDGERKLNWEITSTVDWLKFSKSDGDLPAGSLSVQPIIVTIVDRTTLPNKDIISTTIDILADGTLAKSMKITVKGKKEPMVITEKYSNLGASSVKLNGKIEYEGSPAYELRGFVWATTPEAIKEPENLEPHVSTTSKTSASFSYEVPFIDLTPSQTYYYRAYVTYSGTPVFAKNYEIFSAIVAVNSISLNKPSITLTVGTSETLNAVVLPDNATDKTVIWTSSNSNAATVVNGTVTAVSVGTAIIIATTENGKTATCEITILAPIVTVNSVSLNNPSATLTIGTSEILNATVLPANATNKTVTWTSTNPSVATVDSNGKVTAVSAGSTTIIATTENGKTATCAIIVPPPIVAVNSVSLNKSSITLSIGVSETLIATIQPSTATNKTITWTSSNSNVATVKNGTVTSVSAGTATIVATTENGKTATCAIMVIPYTPIGDIGVQYKDEISNAVTYNEALAACANSTFGGFNDWQLPTQGMLNTMYATRNLIENLDNTALYWSSTPKTYQTPCCPTCPGSSTRMCTNTLGHYYLDMKTGKTTDVGVATSMAKVRCVRIIK